MRPALIVACLVPWLGTGGDGHQGKGLYLPSWPPEGYWFQGKLSNASDGATLGEQSTWSEEQEWKLLPAL